MLKRFQDFITPRLVQKSFRDDDELYLHLITLVATLLCFGIHAYLLAVHLISRTNIFVILNIISILTYICALRLIRLRMYMAACLAVTIEVCFYTFMTSLCMGIETYVLGYYVLVIIMQIIIPYASTRIRQGMIASVLGLTLISIIVSGYGIPNVAPSEELRQVVTISNIFITMIGVMVELFIINVLNNIVADFNDARMDELKNQAYTDPLTELYNRRYADIYFNSIIPKRVYRNYCVATLDIDDFKNINDQYGHACGDEVLRYLAKFLRCGIRKSDMVFRWGGEEFLLVLSDVALPEAYMILEKMRLRLSALDIPTHQGVMRITVTIGVARLEPEAPTKSIENSDKNLYTGKRGSKNIVVA